MKYIVDKELMEDISNRLKALKDENGNRLYSDKEIVYYLLQITRILSSKLPENGTNA